MGEREAFDAAVLGVGDLTVVLVVRVPLDNAGRLASWRAWAEGGRAMVAPPPGAFTLDYRVRETGEAGRVSGPEWHTGEPIGIAPRPPA